MADSKRELLLQEIMSVFSSATPSSSGGGTTWGKVMDSPWQGNDHKAQNLMSILEGNESYIDVVSPDKRDRALDIDINTRVYVGMGTSLRAGANNALADIEEILEANNLWNGLAYGTFFLANSIERSDTNDRNVEISIFLSIRYRTKRTDPRS